jgi:hypothetical protein
VACRDCGTPSARVHDRYRRRLQDLSCAGRPVQVVLEVRRFICGNPACEVATFAEQVDGVTEWRQRRTPRLRAVLERVALALAGRAGARLAAVLGMTVSRCTLLRLIRALPDPEFGQVTVLGVDEFARRKGQTYATILIDLYTHRPLDVMDGRGAEALADWLTAHPGVQVVCRDRSGAFAEGIRLGAPDAQQCADRWQSVVLDWSTELQRDRVDVIRPAQGQMPAACLGQIDVRRPGPPGNLAEDRCLCPAQGCLDSQRIHRFLRETGNPENLGAHVGVCRGERRIAEQHRDEVPMLAEHMGNTRAGTRETAPRPVRECVCQDTGGARSRCGGR